MNYMFYTESELLNIITKREMCDACIQDIHKGDNNILCLTGETPDWKKYTIDEFVQFVFPDKNDAYGVIDEGGILIFKDKESRDNYISKENF